MTKISSSSGQWWHLKDVESLKSVPREGLEPFEIDALDGLIALRDGEDYANTDGRYDRAYEKLTSAFKAYVRRDVKDPCFVSKLYLWRGIALNENKDLDFVERNARAIALYKSGLRRAETAPDCVLMQMALNNSAGVAFHHKRGQDPMVDIPPVSFKYYEKVLQLYLQLKRKDHCAKTIMETVERNSGYKVRRPETPAVVGGGGGTASPRNVI